MPTDQTDPPSSSNHTAASSSTLNNDIQSKHARSRSFINTLENAVSLLVSIGCIYGLYRFARATSLKHAEVRTAEREQSERYMRQLHADWLNQQHEAQKQAETEKQYMEYIMRARRAAYVENTYKHAAHNWESNRRFKPPHYKHWNGTMHGDMDDHYGNLYSPLTPLDVQARSLLGIDVHISNARLDERDVKNAFRHKALIYHPDRQGGSEKAFQRVTEAYDHLMSHIDKRTKQQQKAMGENG